MNVSTCAGVPLLAVRTCLPRPPGLAVPVALRGGEGRMRRPHAQVRLPVARDATL